LPSVRETHESSPEPVREKEYTVKEIKELKSITSRKIMGSNEHSGVQSESSELLVKPKLASYRATSLQVSKEAKELTKELSDIALEIKGK
jgi:hypothetical protein